MTLLRCPVLTTVFPFHPDYVVYNKRAAFIHGDTPTESPMGWDGSKSRSRRFGRPSRPLLPWNAREELTHIANDYVWMFSAYSPGCHTDTEQVDRTRRAALRIWLPLLSSRCHPTAEPNVIGLNAEAALIRTDGTPKELGYLPTKRFRVLRSKGFFATWTGMVNMLSEVPEKEAS